MGMPMPAQMFMDPNMAAQFMYPQFSQATFNNGNNMGGFEQHNQVNNMMQ
jgi:hypothetical protein